MSETGLLGTQLIAVSANAGKTLGSCDAWQAMIDGVHSECLDWSVIFVPECDGDCRQRDCEATSPHTFFAALARGGVFTNGHRYQFSISLVFSESCMPGAIYENSFVRQVEVKS